MTSASFGNGEHLRRVLQAYGMKPESELYNSWKAVNEPRGKTVHDFGVWWQLKDFPYLGHFRVSWNGLTKDLYALHMKTGIMVMLRKCESLADAILLMDGWSSPNSTWYRDLVALWQNTGR